MGVQQMIYAAVAAVIAGLVLLSMYRVQIRGQETAVDAVQYRASKKNVLSMVEMIERDFNDLGSYMRKNGGTFEGVALDPQDVLQPGWYDSTSVAGGYQVWLQFLSQIDSMQVPVTIRYEWEPVDGETVTLNNGTVRQIYEVRRYEDGTLTTNSRLFTAFNITPLTDESLPIMINLHDARRFTVQMRTLSPLGKAQTVEESMFDATYRPVALTIYQ